MPRPDTGSRAAPMLLFVCSGNICRSPMAEAIAAHAARESGFDIRVASSGTMGLVDMPAEDTACQVIEELGLTLRRHRARQATRELVREAALVVAATGSHRSWLRLHEPDAKHIVSFDELTGLGDVPDPYGRSLEEYRAVRDQLVAGMPRVLAELKARHAAGANEG